MYVACLICVITYPVPDLGQMRPCAS